jgi:excisionase family DNA binding protein
MFLERLMATVRPQVAGQKPRSRQKAERLVYTVPEAGRLLGLGRNAAYDAARRGDIPTLRIGRLVLVPKNLLHRMLGINATGGAAVLEEEASNLGDEPQDVAVRREKS